MNTFISLIQFCPNIARSDVFTIGMILRSDIHNYYQVKISESRIKRICRAFEIKDRLLLDAALAGIKKHSFDAQYLHYLHAYENGIIRYTSPKPVATDVPEETFKQLYQIYVADAKEQEHHRNHQRISTIFHNALKKDSLLQTRLNIGYNLDTIVQEYIPSTSTIDFIGGNGSLFCGQMPNLRADDAVSRFILIFESLKQRFEEQQLFEAENYHLFINMERFGSREFYEHRAAFRSWHRLKGFTVVEVDDMNAAVQGIRDKVNAKDVQPFEEWLVGKAS